MPSFPLNPNSRETDHRKRPEISLHAHDSYNNRRGPIRAMKPGRSVMSTRVKIKLDSFGTRDKAFNKVPAPYRSAKDALRLYSHDSI